MKLQYDGARYVLRCDYDERHIPKAAGFWWDPAAKVWHTKDAWRAEKFAFCADGSVPAHVMQAIKGAVSASMAETATIAVPTPPGLELMPFQKAGVAYTIPRHATLIADEMGLGKTVQAIGLVNYVPDINNVLVICPAILRENWRREFEKWLTKPLRVAVASASDRWPTSRVNVVIVNYDVLHKFAPKIAARDWDLLVVDEAHYVKNPKARRSKHVYKIPAKRKLALTGTPIVNRPAELWPILHWLDPKEWPKFWPFAQRYCALHRGWGGHWDTSGASNLDELQRKLRATIMVRRRKADVLLDLPPKLRQVIEFPADGFFKELQEEASIQNRIQRRKEELERLAEEARVNGDDDAFRDAVKQLAQAEAVGLSEMSVVRHETARAKVPLVVDHIENAMEDGRKLVVFGHHRDVLEAMHARFGPAISVLVYGGMKDADRQIAIDRFQNDPDTRIFFGGIQATGVGLTLTAASHVIFAELDWVPGNVTQAEDRCHRIGQKDSVLVQHLVLEGSIDAYMAQTIVAKQAVIDRAIDRKECVNGA